jgi:PEP-CTERM motif
VVLLEGQLRLKHLITKSKLALAVAILSLFASIMPAHADTLTIQPDYELIIPDGSTVTSVSLVVPPGLDAPESYALVDFTFAFGYGTVQANADADGDVGIIVFTNPVSDLSFEYSGGSIFYASIFGEDGVLLNSFTQFAPAATAAEGNASFAGPVTSITWGSGYGIPGGVLSMSYTAVPEPGALLLVGLGLIFLSGLSLKNRST